MAVPTPASNNDFVDVTSVFDGSTSDFSGSIRGTNLGADNEAGEAALLAAASDSGVWYKWTSPTLTPASTSPHTTTVTFSTVPLTAGSFDTVLDVFSVPPGGTAIADLVAEGDSDNCGTSTRSCVTLSSGALASVSEFYIRVGGAAAATGVFNLTSWLRTCERAPAASGSLTGVLLSTFL